MDIARNLINAIALHTSVKNSAFSCIGAILDQKDEQYDSMIQPPNYLKLGTLDRIDFEEKKIFVNVQNPPIANTGDGHRGPYGKISGTGDL